MTDTRKPRYKPGPAKGCAPILVGLGVTRAQLAVQTGFDLVEKGIKPSIKNIKEAQPLLSEGFLNTNSKLLAPCREAWRGRNEGTKSDRLASTLQAEGPGELEPTNVVSLDLARSERAIAELRAEQAAHELTKQKLREVEAVRDRLLKGYADERPIA
jgi:hypothetical protein